METQSVKLTAMKLKADMAEAKALAAEKEARLCRAMSNAYAGWLAQRQPGQVNIIWPAWVWRLREYWPDGEGNFEIYSLNNLHLEDNDLYMYADGAEGKKWYRVGKGDEPLSEDNGRTIKDAYYDLTLMAVYTMSNLKFMEM